MRNGLLFVATFVLSLATANASAGALSGQYKLLVPMTGFQRYNCDQDSCTSFAAGSGSRFIVLEQGDERMIIAFKEIRPGKPDGCTDTAVDKTNLYRISTATMRSFCYRYALGLEHGPLVVPFKLRARNRTITGESTLGYYLGLRLSWFEVSAAPFISGGLALIPVSDVNSGQTENRTGVSCSFGTIVETSQRLQLAVVVGWDFLGGDAGRHWEFEGNPWYSFAIGFSFTGRKN